MSGHLQLPLIKQDNRLLHLGTVAPHKFSHFSSTTKTMATVAQLSASLSISIHDVTAVSSSRTHLPVSRLPTSSFARNGTTFAAGTSLLISRTAYQKKAPGRTTFVSVRCEQGTQQSNGLDVWIGRLAMVGFAGAISVEVATGKGLLENFGLTSPLPTVALAVTGLMGVLVAVFIFQSASKN